MKKYNYYVYITANKSGSTLYIGVTNDLVRRMDEHTRKTIPGFTRAYNVTKLVYYEHFERIENAIIREKEIKGWLRIKKINLIKTFNPEFKDLCNTL